MCEDRGLPRHDTLTSLYVTVDRNLNAPQFEEETLNLEIDENLPVGRSIAQLRATDKDEVSIRIF